MPSPEHIHANSKAQLLDLLAGVELVIFDFDGVIADSEVLSLGTLRDALADYGLDWPLAEVRACFLGKSLRTITSYVAEHSPRSDAACFADAWQTKLFAEFRKHLEPMPGVLNWIAHLRTEGIAFCIASSSSFERIAVALDAMGLSNSFAHVFSAEQVAQGKPAPDLFIYAAAQMGKAADTCLVVEDSPYGIRAAQSANMRALGFVGGQHLHGEQQAHSALLYNTGAEHVIHAFQDLKSGP